MTMTIAQLKAMQACGEALDYVQQHESLKDAWAKCERGDWMLWFLARKVLMDKPTAVRLACAFADRVLHTYETRQPDDLRPRQAVEAALAWVKSPTEENRMAARMAAEAAAMAGAAVVAQAAYAVVYARDATAATAFAAEAAGQAAYQAAYVAACVEVRTSERKWQAEEIRRTIPNPFD